MILPLESIPLEYPVVHSNCSWLKTPKKSYDHCQFYPKTLLLFTSMVHSFHPIPLYCDYMKEVFMSYIIYIPMFHYCNWSLLMIFHYYTSSISHTSHFQQWHSTNHIIYVINDIPTTNKSLIFPPFFQPLKNGVLNHVDTQITMGLKLGSKSWRIWGYPPKTLELTSAFHCHSHHHVFPPCH